MISKTTKSVLFVAILSAIIIPASVLALDQKPLTPEAEVAMIQTHVDELYDATTKLADKTQELDALNSSGTSTIKEINATEKDISDLEKTIDNKTVILVGIQDDLYDRYTIEPVLNAKLEQAKERAKVLRDEMDIPFNGIGISHSQKALNLRIDEKSLTVEKDEAYYRTLLKKEFAGIPMIISFTTIEPEGCALQQANCDPIVGGVQMEAKNHDPCTISLPVTRSGVEGYITASHCVNTGSGTANDVFQHTESAGTKVGDTTVRIFTDDCDCAFIDHSGGEDTETKIWYSSNYFITVTGYTDRVSNGALVMVTGQNSGSKVAIVDDNTDTASYSGLNVDTISTTTHVTQGGDSGAPWSSLAKSNYYGLHVAGDSGASYFVPWENVEAELGL